MRRYHKRSGDFQGLCNITFQPKLPKINMYHAVQKKTKQKKKPHAVQIKEIEINAWVSAVS